MVSSNLFLEVKIFVVAAWAIHLFKIVFNQTYDLLSEAENVHD